jgi:hypothetical protein
MDNPISPSLGRINRGSEHVKGGWTINSAAECYLHTEEVRGLRCAQALFLFHGP